VAAVSGEPLPGRPAGRGAAAARRAAGGPTTEVAWRRSRPPSTAHPRRRPPAGARRGAARGRRPVGGAHVVRAAGHLDAADPRPAAALALVDYRPEDAAPTLERLGGLLESTVEDGHRRFVRFALATAELWSGRRAAAEATLRQVRDADPRASTAWRPTTSCTRPSRTATHPSSWPRRRSQARRRARATGRRTTRRRGHAAGARAELVRLGRRAEARRVFSALVTANPSNVEARVGLAVAGFSKDRPADAFGRLGPLVRDNPTWPRHGCISPSS
jgi:hypothetical protein